MIMYEPNVNLIKFELQQKTTASNTDVDNEPFIKLYLILLNK